MGDSSWHLELAHPAWLAALVVLPLLVYYGRRSLLPSAPWRRAVSLGVRALLVVLLVLALSGIRICSTSPQRFVIFAVDQSLSISDEADEAARAFIDQATEHAGENRWAVLPFAAEPGTVTGELPRTPDIGRSETDLATAIAATRAAIPSSWVPQVVLLTDGNATRGDAAAAARNTSAPISVVPLPGIAEHEVYVSAVETEAEVFQGEPFYLEVVVHSTHDDDGTLRLFDGSEEIAHEQVHLKPGENRFSFRRSIADGPAATYTARIEGVRDTLEANNELAAVTCAPKKVRVLLVEERPESARPLADILQRGKFDVTVRSPEAMPEGTPQWSDELEGFELVILANVPAASLSAESMELIARYVQDFGGGLIAVGGDRAFTSGDYQGTKLEEVLPVWCRVGPHRPKPTQAMMLVIDRSDSMKKGYSIALAKMATRQAIEWLGPQDQAGVIAFEDQSRWITEIRPCTGDEKARMFEQIDKLTAAGGTNMYPAMERAYLALSEAYAELKHMIVLTDGLSQPGDFDELAERIAASGITVSTVGVGEEAAPELLERIASIGGGRYYDCKDPAQIPEVFALEVAHPPRAGIVEELVSPRVENTEEIFPELGLTHVPRLLGYVETQPKDGSRIAISADSGDPLLVWWRYGRGISVAFTSDVRTNWAPLWLEWPAVDHFWIELVRHAMRRDPARDDVVLRVRTENDRAVAVLDAVDGAGNFLNDAEVTLSMIGPEEDGGEAPAMPMDQIAPGRYAAEFSAPEAGSCVLRATLEYGDGSTFVRHRGLATGYGEELRPRPTDEALLRRIAEITDGQYDPQPADVFAHSERTVPRSTPLWRYLLTAAVLIFLLDAGLKRMDVLRRAKPRATS